MLKDRPLLGDPADGVVELKYVSGEFPYGTYCPNQLKEEINAKGLFCCAVYESDSNSVLIAFTLSTPPISVIDQLVSKHVPHSIRLRKFQDKYPRHWWALNNCGYAQNTIIQILEEIRQVEVPPQSTMNLLWVDAGKLETKRRRNKEPSQNHPVAREGPPDDTKPANKGDMWLDATSGTLYIFTGDSDNWVKVNHQDSDDDFRNGFQEAMGQLRGDDDDGEEDEEMGGWDDAVLDRESVLL